MRKLDKKRNSSTKNRAVIESAVSGAFGFECLETRQLMATINVADFGARANDGGDDRQAIVNAINSLDPNDVLSFGDGVYDISASITINKSDFTLQGTGNTTLKGNRSNGAILSFKGDRFQVRKLIFDGGGIFMDHPGGGKNTGVTIDYNRFNLNATGGQKNGITFTSGLKDSKVTNNYFTGYSGGYGMYGYNYEGLTIANNEFINVDAGAHIDCFGGGNLLLEQNYLKGIKNMGFEFQSTANNLVVQDNWFESPSYTSLPGSSGPNSMAYSLIWDKSSNITIRRNVAIMPIKGTTGSDYTRITFEVGGDNTLVEDNYSYGGNHVVAANDGVGTASVTVRNNKFLNYAQGIGNSFPSSTRTLTQYNNGNIRLSNVMEARIAAHDIPGIGSKRYDGSVTVDPTPTPPPPPPVVDPTPTPAPEPTPEPAPTPTAPTGPTGLLALATGGSTVNLFWSDKGSGESGYKVERSANGGDWTQIASLGANSTGYQATGLSAGTEYRFRVCAFNSVGNSSWSNTSSATPAAADPDTKFVSDMTFDSVANGWGQLERDRSNGELGAKDGRALNLDGTNYAKGLGVHSNSEIKVDLDGGYSAFLADIGLDSETGQNGSVVFEVWGDGQLLYTSGIMTAGTAKKAVNVDVSGKQQLVLKVTNADDGKDFDHADWANARLAVAPPEPTPEPEVEPPPAPEPAPVESPESQAVTVYLSDLTYTSATNGWGPVELDTSVGEKPAGDGRTLTLNGKTYQHGLGAHSNSEIRYALNGEYGTFSADIGIDDESGDRGSVNFQVWADDVLLYESGSMTGMTPTKSINVNVQGRQELRLVVTDLDDGDYRDHADWADARLTVLPPKVTYLSDVKYTSATNGWGKVELDSSVGELLAGDGKRITLAGKVYDKGLGVHSNSKLVYDLKGLYSTFTTDLGIDDEVGDRGSVIFQIFADGALMYDSGLMTGSSATKTATVDVAGKSQLWLVVTRGEDGGTYDHADWANARLAAA